MGCVIYYTLSKGKHPFGNDLDVAHQNIKAKKYTLNETDVKIGLEDWPAAEDLIKLMIADDKYLRYVNFTT